jgi:hypothetical protein
MIQYESFGKIVVCLFLLLFMFACTTTRSLTGTSPETLRHSVKTEDMVEIEKKDGDSLSFEVTDVSKEGIHGSSEFVPYSEIQTISVTRASPGRTGLLVAVSIAVLYALEKNFDCGIFYWPDEECDE